MERGPLSSDDFVAFTKKVVPVVHISSKVHGEKYPELHLKVGMGWPQAGIFDAEGQWIARVDTTSLRSDGVAAIQAVLAGEVAGFYALRDKAAQGSRESRAAYLMARFDRGHLTPAEMRGAIGKGSVLGEFQRETVREVLVDLETAACLQGLDGSRPETFGPVAKKLLAQHRSLGLPEGPSGISAWRVIMEDAYLRRDPAVFAMALTAIKATGITGKKFLEANQKRLKSIQEVGK